MRFVQERIGLYDVENRVFSPVDPKRAVISHEAKQPTRIRIRNVAFEGWI